MLLGMLGWELGGWGFGRFRRGWWWIDEVVLQVMLEKSTHFLGGTANGCRMYAAGEMIYSHATRSAVRWSNMITTVTSFIELFCLFYINKPQLQLEIPLHAQYDTTRAFASIVTLVVEDRQFYSKVGLDYGQVGRSFQSIFERGEGISYTYVCMYM